VDDAMHFWLPPEQKIFPQGSMVHTPSFYVYDEVATYQTVSGQIQRQMSLSLDPRKSSPLRDDLKIGGVLNGKLYIDLLNSN
jgi:methylglyoxal synthase